ncbi:hypothetical protein E4U43_004227 [Claviceps pusilla]|uniref:Ysc84 actin-binding domain-containing protein n=1 Tax=Claviceps pusilla TaxID=123648 RepID=A0A9P7N508_9HYPO|nr:hypothetical protein E4U43_004227 [Claviceps pusilla]
MQRVSAFLPSWDRRSSSSSSSAPKHYSSGGGIFNWAARNSIIGNAAGNNITLPGSSRSAQPVAKSLARINVAAANRNGDRVQREAFWPSTLDMESLKAARILKSFCFDGFLAPVQQIETEVPASGGIQTSTSSRMSTSEPRTPVSVMHKIPRRIIQNAAGIAVFTCMRSGLWMTGSGGSGILIARKSDGTWSPPSGIMLHTPTLSFIIGVDIYDCVLVVTNLAALEAITQPRVTLGEDVSLKNGPSTTLDSDQVTLDWKTLDNTVLAYMKARGQHQSVNLHGCILTERANENERFYGSEVAQMDILAGNVARHVEETKPLFEVIKLAEGRSDYDKAMIELTAVEPAPSDAIIATPKSTTSSPRPAFGFVKPDDPDPFGILALEMAGLEIREAGSRLRPSSSQFDLISNPRSPSLSRFDRQSIDIFAGKSNRASIRSLNTIKSQMTDAGTQTDVGKRDTPETTPSPDQSEDGCEGASIDDVTKSPESNRTGAAADVNHTREDLTQPEHTSPRHLTVSHHPERPAIPPRNRPVSFTLATHDADKADPTVKTRGAEEVEEEEEEEKEEDEEEDDLDYDTNDADDEDDLDVSDDEPVVFEVAHVQPTRTRAVASRMISAKGSVVTIPKRIPPPLPTRSPARNSRCAKSEGGVDNNGMALSPLRFAFSEADLGSEEEQLLQKRSVERSSAILPTSKSAEFVQTHRRETIGHFKLGDAPSPSRQADEVVQTRPSIDATLQVSRPLSVAVSGQAANFDNELARAMEIPLPDDDHTEHSPVEKSDNETEAETETETEPESEPESDAKSESKFGSVEDPQMEDEVALKTSRASINNSDSATMTGKKHTSSIYTRLTEDRWSIDRSSLTTPTSERPMSVVGYITEEDTPTRISREEELEADGCQNIMLNKAVEKPMTTPPMIPIRST